MALLRNYYRTEWGWKWTSALQRNDWIKKCITIPVIYASITSLYDNALIPRFDGVMLSVKNNVPGTGFKRKHPAAAIPAVARAILDWFIHKDHFYQKHEYYAEEKQTGIKAGSDQPSPRPGKIPIARPRMKCTVIHWTERSIAEGIHSWIWLLNGPIQNYRNHHGKRLNGAIIFLQVPNTKSVFLYNQNGFIISIASQGKDMFQPYCLVWINETGKQKGCFHKGGFRYLKGKWWPVLPWNYDKVHPVVNAIIRKPKTG